MPRNNPWRRWKPGEVVPTFATSGRPRDGTVIHADQLRSPIPGICPHLECPVTLMDWSDPPSGVLDKLGVESNPPSRLDNLRDNTLGSDKIFLPYL